MCFASSYQQQNIQLAGPEANLTPQDRDDMLTSALNVLKSNDHTEIFFWRYSIGFRWRVGLVRKMIGHTPWAKYWTMELMLPIGQK